jgi:periplasmic protein CpxP/Spy
MKKSILTLALFIGFATLGFSQESAKRARLTPEERAQKKTEALAEKLSLTKEQQEKVLAINLEEAKKNEAFMKREREERSKEMTERRALMKSNDEKINAILTADQKKAYQEFKEQRRDKVRKVHAHGRPARKDKAE